MISFSGIDCGGKSTQIEKVAQAFQNQNKRYKVIHSRVGYTPMLEAFKDLIRIDKGYSDKQKAEYREKINQSSTKRHLLLWLSIFDLALYYGIYFRLVELFGRTILADRYFWDSYIDLKMKYPDINYEKWLVWKFCCRIFMPPKRSLIYVIPAEVSMYRSTLKEEPWPEPIEVRKKRIDLYMEEITNNRWTDVIDATVSIEDVFNTTMEILKK